MMKMEWIKCSDRLPVRGVSVLASGYEDKINNSIYVAWIESFVNNNPIWTYSWCCGCHPEYKITHWCELPKFTEINDD